MNLRTSALVVAVLGAVSLGVTAQTHAVPARDGVAVTASRAATVEVVAVGDIACPPGASVTATRCRQADTARLAAGLQPDAVLALGDLQYESGSLEHFRNSYDRSWGALKSITHPVPGNHEYKTPGAAGYYAYFDDRLPDRRPAYYARTLGAWRLYALNTSCGSNCDPQYRWFKANLEANPTRCSLVTMHHPRFSSGEHGSNAGMRRFFAIADNHGVDVILAGHDHHYERFRRLNADGAATRNGAMQFVSGAGGKSHYPVHTRRPGSVFVDDDTFGVLKLSLASTSFSWAFHTVDRTVVDSGGRNCL